MSALDPDRRIETWLRAELDAVSEPARALQGAIDAAAVTAQDHGRLRWLRQLLGLDTTTIHRGRLDRPEVVLGPPGAPSGSRNVTAVPAARPSAWPVLAAAILATVLLLSLGAWLVAGPGQALLGGADTGGTTVPEQPQRPLDPPGPDRVIVVDPADGHFTTLSGAVAVAVAGDRIELHPGTYQAEIAIDEAITIAGVGDRGEIVVEPLPLTAGESETDRLHVLFTLRDSEAVLQGFTLRGSSNGTAVVIEGGAPVLEDLVIDPAGDMATAGPTQPREALSVSGPARPTIRNSVLTSLAGISDGAEPLFEDVVFRGGCLFVDEAGTSPTLRDSDFVNSQCPGFSLSVSGGAHALVEASRIVSNEDMAGIRVANDGSSVAITGSEISGGREGVSASFGAEVELNRTNVHGADVGVRVLDADLVLQDAFVIDNRVGLEVSGDSYLETTGTDICDNGRNLDLRDGATVPFEHNQVCIDGSSELASTAGS